MRDFYIKDISQFHIFDLKSLLQLISASTILTNTLLFSISFYVYNFGTKNRSCGDRKKSVHSFN